MFRKGWSEMSAHKLDFYRSKQNALVLVFGLQTNVTVPSNQFSCNQLH